ncbi:MAG TPA: nucleoside-diphosphate sugar epimerase/dehydratase [Armatimonadaceae bacterium]|nr:nucleoside-diphosphate sugar epimerase/dehydratase [Armatimonadaceae bacterium]
MRFNQISRRIVAQVLVDAVLVVLATLTAFALRYDQADPTNLMQQRNILYTLPVLMLLRISSVQLFHLYRIHWRYLSIHDLRLLLGATTLSTGAFFLFLASVGLWRQSDYSWGMQIIDWFINLFLLSGVRILYRQISDADLLRFGAEEVRPRQRALMVGAGDTGEAIARHLKRCPQDGIIPIGFVDDDPLKRRIRIHGLPVLGTTHDIPALAAKHEADIILVAIASASGQVLRDIVSRCEKTTARLCILPSVPEMLETGQSTRPPIRDINIEDLLRREPVRTDMDDIAKYISGQRVLVTGAGGSIGSELCRQICALNPARLLLLGQGENSIFEMEQELIREFGYAPTALIGDVKDRNRLEEIFLHERPTVVFHAAAHKHVPLMEANPQEAVKNNVLGTRNVAELAAQCGVKKFILVSTDKAVNPTSVMGATKRIGEMIIQSMAGAGIGTTEFAAVRFGNVLGSRGSVIPVMRKQIARGGPVTVTHPQMTRYFMTIPEAVQLILQAGTLGRRGQIFILDMGEPVRILDLARDLIRLSGFRPEIDIKIEYTGIRPGEKLHEELLYNEEGKERTAHEKIFVSKCNGVDREALMLDVDRLIRLAREGETPDRLRDEIMRVAHNAFCPPQERASETNVPASEGVPFS